MRAFAVGLFLALFALPAFAADYELVPIFSKQDGEEYTSLPGLSITSKIFYITGIGSMHVTIYSDACN